MLARARERETMLPVRREDRALLESNPSARPDAGGWTGASAYGAPPPSRPSIGEKAINSRSEGIAPGTAKDVLYRAPVGHMSVSSGRREECYSHRTRSEPGREECCPERARSEPGLSWAKQRGIRDAFVLVKLPRDGALRIECAPLAKEGGGRAAGKENPAEGRRYGRGPTTLGCGRTPSTQTGSSLRINPLVLLRSPGICRPRRRANRPDSPVRQSSGVVTPWVVSFQAGPTWADSSC